ncbi:alpha/beta hydrolase [Natronomonas sp. EA1]|uniref:alpha/beta hydrolase n=1 Tax=Natronomonas sp. EA1 TaxID=3421655 RepID=UPI003EBEBE19
MPERAPAMDEQARSVVEEIDSLGVPAWHTMSVESARRVEDEVFSGGNPPAVEVVRNVAFDGPGGEVPVRVLIPESPEGTLVFYHGGGWTLGTLDSVENICRELATRANLVVAAVDYRLAPEHPFPAAVDDAFAALEWVGENREAFGGEGPLFVGGTSAGGNLAAATALHARDAGIDLAGQLLAYPITDYAFDTESYRANADGPLLTRDDMRWFWEQYCRSPVDGANPYASVLRADVAGTAPACVVTAGFDPLRDEGVAYAEKLESAGVPVEHHHEPALPHGFLSLTESVDRADEAMGEIAAWLADR